MAGWNTERAARGDPPLEVRIAVNTGEAIVGDIGSERRVDYTVLGNAVNVAARLEEFVAQPGDIVVGPETWAAVQGSVRGGPARLLRAQGPLGPGSALQGPLLPGPGGAERPHDSASGAAIRGARVSESRRGAAADRLRHEPRRKGAGGGAARLLDRAAGRRAPGAAGSRSFRHRGGEGALRVRDAVASGPRGGQRPRHPGVGRLSGRAREVGRDERRHPRASAHARRVRGSGARPRSAPSRTTTGARS